jgi:hypothetical protein
MFQKTINPQLLEQLHTLNKGKVCNILDSSSLARELRNIDLLYTIFMLNYAIIINIVKLNNRGSNHHDNQC